MDPQSYVAITRPHTDGYRLVHFNGRFNSKTVHKATAYGAELFEMDWGKYRDPLVRLTIARSGNCNDGQGSGQVSRVHVEPKW